MGDEPRSMVGRGTASPLRTLNLELIFVKLGGSILTDKTKPEALATDTLAAVANVVAETLRDQPHLRLLVGHGGGSFGHYWAEKYGLGHGVTDADGWEGVARVADAMGRLNRAVVAALVTAGVNALGVQPAASALAAGGQLRQLETVSLRRMLQAGLTPVLHGDVVMDDVQGAAIVSTEALFAFLVPRLQPKRLVLVGEQAVFTADPRRDASAQRIGAITAANIETVLRQVGGSHGADVTGGMASKVRTMWQLVQAVPGLEVQIIGSDADTLRQALRGEQITGGTMIRLR